MKTRRLVSPGLSISTRIDRVRGGDFRTLFVLLLVLSPPRRTVLVLELEPIQYSNPAYWSASSRELPRSTIGIAAVQTAIEYEYDEIRCDGRTGAQRPLRESAMIQSLS
ncbi:MAG: hypothetical protein LW699_11290 [Pirellula sp.]|nr:hypothetical protein [Pirellula sp.]